MRLEEALDQIEQMNDDDVIFARRPWTLQSDAKVGTLDQNFGVPAAIKNIGFEYFLEANVAIEVLEVFGERKPTADERRKLLLFYAENDAYPDWVYE